MTGVPVLRSEDLLQLAPLNGGSSRATNFTLAKIRDGGSPARVNLELLCVYTISVEVERYA